MAEAFAPRCDPSLSIGAVSFLREIALDAALKSGHEPGQNSSDLIPLPENSPVNTIIKVVSELRRDGFPEDEVYRLARARLEGWPFQGEHEQFAERMRLHAAERRLRADDGFCTVAEDEQDNGE